MAAIEHAQDADRDVDFATVPIPDSDAEVDPHWLRLRGGSPDLPALYMPPSMPGRHSAGLRAVAMILVAVFVAATAAGICLTYGAPHHPF